MSFIDRVFQGSPQSTKTTDTGKSTPWWKYIPAIGVPSAMGGAAFSDKGRNWLFGSEGKAEPYDALSPEAMGFQKDMLSKMQTDMPGFFKFLQQFMGDDQASLDQFSAPYMRQFKQNIVPTITERFGGGDSGASSGMQNALAEAGTDLEERIASGRQQMGLKAAGLFGGMVPSALQPTRGMTNTSPQSGSAADIMKIVSTLMTLL